MKKNLKTIIIIVSILLIVGVILVIGIVNDKKNASKNMESIKENYELFINNVNEYNLIRSSLSDKLNNFIYDEYENEHSGYVELLTKYNNNVGMIAINVNDIKIKCNVIYSDIDVNKICDSYALLYEKLVNLYVMDLNNYNSKISSYNVYKEANIDLFNMLYNEYIDYNNDGKFEGVVSDGE